MESDHVLNRGSSTASLSQKGKSVAGIKLPQEKTLPKVCKGENRRQLENHVAWLSASKNWTPKPKPSIGVGE